MNKVNKCTADEYCNCHHYKACNKCKYFKPKKKTIYKCEYISLFGGRCFNIMARFNAKFKDLKELIDRYKLEIEDIELDE